MFVLKRPLHRHGPSARLRPFLRLLGLCLPACRAVLQQDDGVGIHDLAEPRGLGQLLDRLFGGASLADLVRPDLLMDQDETNAVLIERGERVVRDFPFVEALLG